MSQTLTPKSPSISVQANGTRSLEDYAEMFYHKPQLAWALQSNHPALANLGVTQPIPKGTLLTFPAVLVGRNASIRGAFHMDASYRRTGAVILLYDPAHPGSLMGAPKPVAGKPYVRRQWVNQKTLHLGQDGSGWARSIWVAPAGCDKVEGVAWGAPTLLTIRVRFSAPVSSKPGVVLKRCERTDPAWGVIPQPDFTIQPPSLLPAVAKSQLMAIEPLQAAHGGALKNTACSSRPTEHILTRLLQPTDPAFGFTVFFGIGGGDRCEIAVTTGDPKQGFEFEVVFENWRKIRYDLNFPDSIDPLYVDQSSGKWGFSQPIRSRMSSILGESFVEAEAMVTNRFPLGKNVIGAVPGSYANLSKPWMLTATESSDNRLPGALKQGADKTRVRITLVDKTFAGTNSPYTCTVEAKDVHDEISLKGVSGFPPNGVLPPTMLADNVPGMGPIGSSPIVGKPGWEAKIALPSKYLLMPDVQFMAAGVACGFNVGCRLSMVDAAGAVLDDGLGAQIQLDIPFVSTHTNLSDSQVQTILSFLEKHALGRNVRKGSYWFSIEPIPVAAGKLGRFSEGNIVDSSAFAADPNEIYAKRRKQVTEVVEFSTALKLPKYLHPGLDEKGKPRKGPVADSWFQVTGTQSFAADLPTASPGKALEPGDFVGASESYSKCPIELSLDFWAAKFMLGGNEKGAGELLLNAGFVRIANAEANEYIQKHFAHCLIHEMAHSMGLAPYFATGSKLFGSIVGMADPPNVDQIWPDHSQGDYYFWAAKAGVLGSNGVRQGGMGSHCAYGLSNTDKALGDYSKLLGDCIMYGSRTFGKPIPDHFCPHCEVVLRARRLEDVCSKWEGRNAGEY